MVDVADGDFLALFDILRCDQELPPPRLPDHSVGYARVVDEVTWAVQSSADSD